MSRTMSVNLTALLERVAALEARDGDSLVTVEDCGTGGFPDYGENATSPEGFNTCVLVYSTVWFWLGASCILGPLLLPLAIFVLELAWALVWAILRGCLCCGWFDYLFRKLFGNGWFTKWFLRTTALNDVSGVWGLERGLANYVGDLIYNSDAAGMWGILICLGPSTLLLGGYQRDYHYAGYVLVGLALLVLVLRGLYFVGKAAKLGHNLKLALAKVVEVVKAVSVLAVKTVKAKAKATEDMVKPADSESAAGAGDVAVAVDGETENVEPAAVDGNLYYKNRESDTELKALNIYNDIVTPLLTVLVYGAAQIMLVGFYIYSLYVNGRPDFTNTDTYIFYFAGCLFQIILISKHQDEDTGIFWAAGKRRLFKDGEPVKIGRLDILIRQILDLAINSCAAPVIYLSLPLQLAGTSTTYFDFMLNSCATAFILELDDREGRTYTLKSAAAAAAAKESRTTAAISDQEPAAKCERSARASTNSSDPVAEEHV